MTTPNEELRKLAEAAIPAMVYEREYKNFEKSITPECVIALLDQLQSQVERIAMLESLNELAVKQAETLVKQRDTLRAELADAELHTKQVERGLDKATAQLAEIEKTEPVGYANAGYLESISEGYAYVYPSKMTGASIPLFTHPMPAQGVEAGMVNLPEPVAWFANYGGNVYTEAQLKQAVRDALDAQGVTELVEAFEHHIEQTRPIERSTIALSKYKAQNNEPTIRRPT